ncbi:MAG: Trk family potassium uptake protein [Chloroflexi bacterium RBG_13_54_8]|nr:MAG: Trk family potassium uptake protein [Chloroflexi bacterium RBG_13_54_8]
MPWSISILEVLKPRARGTLSPFILLYGFVAIIMVGAVLLVLPIAAKTGQSASFLTALFTATSATCVTGLVVVDTGTYWSSFGQAVILVLIQVGGLGFMTSATLLLMALGRRIGLRERLLIGESMGLERWGGVVGLAKRIALFTLLVESVGALLLYFRFSLENPMGTAVWKGIFHSVSAFNNAGLDILGNFRSLADYRGDTTVVLVIAALIILGGISFMVVSDVFRFRRWIRLSLDSKIVLMATAILLALGMIVILLTEFSNPDTLGALPWPQKALNAFFHSVTPRTAGFSTIDIGMLADYALFFIIILMFIGGASGSTAGGVKVNTFGLIAATIWSSLRGRQYAGAFGREFRTEQVYRALALVMLSLGLVAVVVLVLTRTEKFSFINLLFETVSAFGTVGLSTGITPHLSTAGQLIIIATMLAGRLGPLTLALSLVQRQRPAAYRYPEDQIRIG